jgi:serine/threonine protein kinase
MTDVGRDSRVLDRTVIELMPRPIAAAWQCVRTATETGERLPRLITAYEVTLRTLVAFLLPDYVRGPADPKAEEALEALRRPSLGHYLALLRHVARAMEARSGPPPFLGDAVEWLRTGPGSGTGAARMLDELLEQRNRLAHGAPLSAADAAAQTMALRDRLRAVLASLRWLARYRPFQVVGQAPTRRGTVEGRVKLLIGHADGEPVTARWRGLLLSGPVYLAAPHGGAALEVSPFIEVGVDPRTGLERCFLFRSAPRMKRLVATDDATGAVREDVAFHGPDGEVAFDGWLADRAALAPVVALEDLGGTLAAPASSTLIPDGTLLGGRYRLRGVLGEGGMAVVYRALDTAFEEEVALKVQKLACAADETLRERFFREAQTMRAAAHPHVLTIGDLGTLEDGRPYIKMPLMAGGSLRDRVKPGGLPPAEVLLALAAVAGALAHLHSLGIVHRDVKPSNVLVDADGGIHLADFGIALRGDQARLTRTFENLGSLAYMAPERRAGRDDSPAGDIYSLALVAHELLTGELPVGRAGAGLSGPLGELLRRMSADAPNDRPRAGDVQTALESLADAGVAAVVGALPTTPASPAPAPEVPALSTQDAPAEQGAGVGPVVSEGRERRPRRLLPVLAATVAFAAIAVGVAIGLGGGRGEGEDGAFPRPLDAAAQLGDHPRGNESEAVANVPAAPPDPPVTRAALARDAADLAGRWVAAYSEPAGDVCGLTTSDFSTRSDWDGQPGKTHPRAKFCKDVEWLRTRNTTFLVRLEGEPSVELAAGDEPDAATVSFDQNWCQVRPKYSYSSRGRVTLHLRREDREWRVAGERFVGAERRENAGCLGR